MKQITYILILAAAIATMAIGFKAMSSTISAKWVGFIIWTVSPYLYLAAMTKAVSKITSTIAVLVFAPLVGIFGVWAFIDAMFINTDAQGALIFIFAPLWQWVILILFTFPLYLLNRVKKS